MHRFHISNQQRIELLGFRTFSHGIKANIWVIAETDCKSLLMDEGHS